MRSYILILTMVVNISCASLDKSEKKYTFLPPYEATNPILAEKPQTSGLTKFDAFGVNSGTYILNGKEIKFPAGLLFSEYHSALYVHNKNKLDEYISLYNTEKSMRKDLYDYAKESEEIYQKQIDKTRDTWWDRHKLEIGYFLGVVSSITIIYGASKLVRQ